jgi:hypothetical protein
MSFEEVFGIVCLAFLFFWILFGAYQKAKGNAFGMMAELIAYAEKTGLAGPDKMDMVVNDLYEIVPAPFRFILTRERIRAAAQNIFNSMKDYALEYLREKTGKTAVIITEDSDAAEEVEEPQEEDEDQLFIEEYDIVPQIEEDGPPS